MLTVSSFVFFLFFLSLADEKRCSLRLLEFKDSQLHLNGHETENLFARKCSDSLSTFNVHVLPQTLTTICTQILQIIIQRNLKYKHDVNVTALAVRNRLRKVTYYYFAPMRMRSIATSVSVYDCH